MKLLLIVVLGFFNINVFASDCEGAFNLVKKITNTIKNKIGEIPPFFIIDTVDKKSANDYNSEGLELFRLKSFFEAMQQFDKAIKLEPEFVEAYLNRGRVKAQVGNFVAAMTDYNKAIKLDSKSAETYYHRSFANAALEQYLEAIVDKEVSKYIYKIRKNEALVKPDNQ